MDKDQVNVALKEDIEAIIRTPILKTGSQSLQNERSYQANMIRNTNQI